MATSVANEKDEDQSAYDDEIYRKSTRSLVFIHTLVGSPREPGKNKTLAFFLKLVPQNSRLRPNGGPRFCSYMRSAYICPNRDSFHYHYHLIESPLIKSRHAGLEWGTLGNSRLDQDLREKKKRNPSHRPYPRKIDNF